MASIGTHHSDRKGFNFMTETLPGAPAGLNEMSPSARPEENSSREYEQRFRNTQMRAYKLWEDAGRPEGDAERERFWREAETQNKGDGSPLHGDNVRDAKSLRGGEDG